MITGHSATYALLGHPVAHSLSPAMHNAWFAAYGVDAVYVALPVPPSAGALVDAIRTLGLAGANVTVPHKARVLEALDEVGPVAEACGAVNTIVRRGDRLLGYNTDADGFVRAWEEAGGLPGGTRAVVLGAGGAGRAVALGLARAGAHRVVLLNRSTRSIARLEAAAGPTTVRIAGFDAWTGLVRDADVIVNALPAAGRQLVDALDTADLSPDAWWCDLNYWDSAPPGLARARAQGLRTLTGHGMLLHQGALAFSRFTGIEPDPALTRSLLDRAPT